MKHSINKLTILVVFLLAGSIYAQQENNYILYRNTMNIVNPAYAGADGTTNLTTNLRSQWEEVVDAPETQSFFFSMPAGDRMGLGASIVNDKTFVESETSFFVDFSYRLPMADDTNLFLGLKAGGSTYDVNSGFLNSRGFDQDPALENIDTGFRPNFGIGAYLQNEKYFISLSSPNLFGTQGVSVDDGGITYSNDRAHYYLAGGYNFDIGGDTQFRPSTMIRYVSGSPVSADITAAFKFFQKFELGAVYRTDEALGGLAVIDLAEWMQIGYSYGSSLNDQLNNVNDGTHEILIRFNFGGDASDESVLNN